MVWGCKLNYLMSNNQIITILSQIKTRARLVLCEQTRVLNEQNKNQNRKVLVSITWIYDILMIIVYTKKTMKTCLIEVST